MKAIKLLVLLIVSFNMSCTSDDKTINVAADDPQMLEAFTKARESLPKFWSIQEDPKSGESDFALKVKVEDDNGVEYFWLVDLSREKNGKIFGEIGNDPNTVKSVKIGERIEAQPENIVDWLYLKDGKIVGNYTVRPLLKLMPEAEAAEYKKKLAEP